MASVQVSRSGSYFDLVEGFAQPGCAVCGFVLRAVHRYLDVLSYESVNDPGFREALRSARGFCNRHAWRFVREIGDPLGVAIIYRDVLRAVLAPLELRADPSALEPQGPCQACRVEQDTTTRYLRLLLEQLHFERFRLAFQRSDGLCLPHLITALELAGAEEAEHLLRAQAWDGQAAATSSHHPARGAATRPLPFEMLAGRAGVADAWREAPVAAGTHLDVHQPEKADAQALAGAAETSPPCPLCEAALAGASAGVRAIAGSRGPEWSSRLIAARGLCNLHTWQLAEALADPPRSPPWPRRTEA